MADLLPDQSACTCRPVIVREHVVDLLLCPQHGYEIERDRLRAENEALRLALADVVEGETADEGTPQWYALRNARGLLAIASGDQIQSCPECGVAPRERHRDGCFFLTGDPADLRGATDDLDRAS